MCKIAYFWINKYFKTVRKYVGCSMHMGNMNVIRTCYIHHVASEDTEVSIECALHNLTGMIILVLFAYCFMNTVNLLFSHTVFFCYIVGKYEISDVASDWRVINAGLYIRMPPNISPWHHTQFMSEKTQMRLSAFLYLCVHLACSPLWV